MESKYSKYILIVLTALCVLLSLIHIFAKRELLIEMIDGLSDEAAVRNPDIIYEKVASMSCKAAVKGHMSMSAMEANELIDQLLHLDNPYNCPHGRPVIISMTKYELEKKFKRIV